MIKAKKGQTTQREKSSRMIRFADGIRGILSIIAGISLIIAIILGQSGLMITLDDIIENLLWANAGKIILILIALALLLTGMKQLRWMK